MAKSKRCRIFICNEPGPGKKWFTWIYLPDGSNGPSTDLVTQKVAVAEGKALAKLHSPATVVIQGRDGRYREVFSFPPVRNKPGDERRKGK